MSTARPALVVRATAEQSSRRAALGLIASTIAAGVSAKAAQAIEIPIRAAQQGMTRSSTAASMSGYTLEGAAVGTKKSGITPKRKAEVLKQLRAREGLN